MINVNKTQNKLSLQNYAFNLCTQTNLSTHLIIKVLNWNNIAVKYF